VKLAHPRAIYLLSESPDGSAAPVRQSGHRRRSNAQRGQKSVVLEQQIAIDASMALARFLFYEMGAAR
jgi:hypothetical protein